MYLVSLILETVFDVNICITNKLYVNENIMSLHPPFGFHKRTITMVTVYFVSGRLIKN